MGEEETKKRSPRDELSRGIRELNGGLAEMVVAWREAQATIKEKEATIKELQDEYFNVCKQLAERTDATLERQIRLEDARADREAAVLKASSAEKDREQARAVIGAITTTAKQIALARTGTPAPDSEIVMLAQDVFLAITPKTRAVIFEEVGQERIVRLLAAIGLAG